MSIAVPAASDEPAPVAGGTMNVRIVRASPDARLDKDDRVAVEAPLEYWLHHPSLGPEPVSFGTTMRTPGDDEALAVGLLYGEGIIDRATDIAAVETSTRKPNVVNVRFQPDVQMQIMTATRRFSAGSSCGVCGTTGLDAAIARAAATRITATGSIDASVLLALPRRMRDRQSKFGDTGGMHASALFDLAGAYIASAEDVGRHNAFDKLVGECLMAGRLPLQSHIAVLSGRASFELVQKALRAGVAILAAIGAPSSLAVNLALSSGLTLVGFLQDRRFNIYAAPHRITGSP